MKIDDDKFDKVIKEKVGDYQVDGFDPAAFEAFKQAGGIQGRRPWYRRVRRELMVAALMLLIFGSSFFAYWKFHQVEVMGLKEELALLRLQNSLISDLRNEITTLKDRKPDTLFIQTATPSFVQAGQNESLEVKPAAPSNQMNVASTFSEMGVTKELLSEIQDNLPAEVWDKLLSNDLVIEEEPESLKVVTKESYRPIQSVVLLPENAFLDKLNAGILNDLLEMGEIAPFSYNVRYKEAEKRQKDYYSKPTEIYFGPTGGLSSTGFESGNGEADLSFGIEGQMTFKNHWSFTTGINYIKRGYGISPDQVGAGTNLPAADPSIGILDDIDVISTVLEVPLNVRYQGQLSKRMNWFAGTGYSFIWFPTQNFNYIYEVANDQNLIVELESDNISNARSAYSGNLIFTLGLQSKLKNGNMLELAPFYQKATGNQGLEALKRDVIGLKLSYWLRLK